MQPNMQRHWYAMMHKGQHGGSKRNSHAFADESKSIKHAFNQVEEKDTRSSFPLNIDRR